MDLEKMKVAEALKWLKAQPQWQVGFLKVLDDLRREAFSEWADTDEIKPDALVKIKAGETVLKRLLIRIDDVINQASEEAARHSELKAEAEVDEHSQIGLATNNEEILGLIKPIPLAIIPEGTVETEPAK